MWVGKVQLDYFKGFVKFSFEHHTCWQHIQRPNQLVKMHTRSSSKCKVMVLVA